MQKKTFLMVAVAAYLAIDITGGQIICAAPAASAAKGLDSYELPTQVVQDNQQSNPYLTGGDVDVVTAQEIENRHFADITAALSTVPGVIIQTPGYHGGEYGYGSYNTHVSINGENNITVLVNGVPVNNGIDSRTGNNQGVDFSTLPNINDIAQIQVIKGTGSSIYGSSSAGGVINIITKAGTIKPKMTLNIATGSWGHHKYMVTQTGATDDGSLRYVASLGQERSGDTKYKDPFGGSTQTYDNTRWESKNAYLNITKDFDATHNLELTYTHANQIDHYPITAPDTRYLSSFYNSTMAPINSSTMRYKSGTLNSKVPGYRNIFLYDAWLGSYDKTLTNNINAKYTFAKTPSGATSYVSVYKNYTHYYTADYSSIWNVPYKYYDEMKQSAYTNGINSHTDIQKVEGVRLQLAKEVANHNFTGGFDFAKSSYSHMDGDPTDTGTSTRNQYYFFLQDKIKASDKFTFTPGVNYAVYGQGTYRGNWGGNSHFDAAHKLTGSLYGAYRFDEKSDIYFGVAQIFRPVSGVDASNANEKLNDEVGTNYSIGVNHKFDARNKLSIGYNDVDMSNTIASYSILVNDKWKSQTINAERQKRALNISYDHRFDQYWKAGLAYSWVNEHFNAKHNVVNPDGTTADQLINAYRPRNIYRFDLSYEKDKWLTLLDYTLYCGNNTQYFTAKKFAVANLAINYKVNPQTTAYLTVNNLFNTAYQTYSSSYSGMGSYPQPSRNYMLGLNYTF